MITAPVERRTAEGNDHLIEPHLNNRVAIVTGANTGIGAAIAFALAEQGARVLLAFKRMSAGDDQDAPPEYDQNRARDATWVVEKIASNGGHAMELEVDLARPSSIQSVFVRAESAWGPVEILVNNAAFGMRDSFLPSSRDHRGLQHESLTTDGFDSHFIVNSRAPALLIAEYARRHIQHSGAWGRIIGITSAGRHGFPGEVSYGASKAALESVTFSAASELASYGVTANVVEPGATDTGWMSDSLKERIRNESPIGHIMQPSEVAETVVFLASHQARFITGQRLRLGLRS